jgi:hypothetical protein
LTAPHSRHQTASGGISADVTTISATWAGARDAPRSRRPQKRAVKSAQKPAAASAGTAGPAPAAPATAPSGHRRGIVPARRAPDPAAVQVGVLPVQQRVEQHLPLLPQAGAPRRRPDRVDDHGPGRLHDPGPPPQQGEVQVAVLAPGGREALVEAADRLQRGAAAEAIRRHELRRRQPRRVALEAVGRGDSGTTTRPATAATSGSRSKTSTPSASQRASGKQSSSVKATTAPRAWRQPGFRAAAGPCAPATAA